MLGRLEGREHLSWAQGPRTFKPGSAPLRPGLTLQHGSSSCSSSSLDPGTSSTPVQHFPLLLLGLGRAEAGSAPALFLDLGMLSGLQEGALSSHSSTQEATEMLPQELERLGTRGATRLSPASAGSPQLWGEGRGQ